MTTAGNDTGSSREEELLARVYRQVTARQSGRFASTYNVSMGLARFSDWLHEYDAVHPDQAVPAGSRPGVARRTAVTEPSWPDESPRR